METQLHSTSKFHQLKYDCWILADLGAFNGFGGLRSTPKRSESQMACRPSKWPLEADPLRFISLGSDAEGTA